MTGQISSESIPVWLKRWMRQLDLTVDQLAEGVGVRSITAKRWLNGENSPKSEHTLQKIIDYMKSVGVTDVPSEYSKTAALPLDDQEGASIYLVTHSNPIIHYEGAEFVLRKLISEDRKVTYVILSFDSTVFDLELFPFFRAVIKRLEADGISASKVESSLNVYVLRRSACGLLASVAEAILGNGVLIANLSTTDELMSASIMHRMEYEARSRNPIPFDEARVFPNPSSFEKLVRILKNDTGGELMNLDVLRISESPFEYLDELKEEFT